MIFRLTSDPHRDDRRQAVRLHQNTATTNAQKKERERVINRNQILRSLLRKGENKINVHAPLEALQSRNPSVRICLVCIGLTNFTLSKQVYLRCGSSTRVCGRENETNAYPRASAKLLYSLINGRLIYTLTAKRLYDLSLSEKSRKDSGIHIHQYDR